MAALSPLVRSQVLSRWSDSTPTRLLDGYGPAMADPGHVFVVRGRIENLDHDAMILPTDNRFFVTSTWAAALGASPGVVGELRAWQHATGLLRPSGWPQHRWGRAPEGVENVPLLHPTWFVDAVHYGGDGERWLGPFMDRVRAALADIAAAAIVPRSGRPRPLIALPTLGVGDGGFGEMRGRVIDELLRVCEEATTGTEIDVVIVAADPSDHAAFEARRRASASASVHELHLGPDLLATAVELAGRVRDGSLALFLGAGVSMSAGLPSWEDLIEDLSAKAGVDVTGVASPLDRAELLRRKLGEGLGDAVAESVTGRSRYGLNHALLGALECDQVVTTNYDGLYERAVADAGRGVIPVLPFDQALPRAPWLLKMHGDATHPKTIVLSRSDFVGYDARSRPMGAVVQALLMTKHLLVVGSSMTDDNFLRLAHEVVSFRATGRAEGYVTNEEEPLGTVVTLVEKPAARLLWEGRFDYVATSPDKEESGTSARLLAIFLDALSMHATPPAHLADHRYAALLADDEARGIAEAARELDRQIASSRTPELWRSLSDALAAAGAHRPVP